MAEKDRIKVIIDSDLIDIIPSYLEKIKEKLSQMRESEKGDDFEHVRTVAHQITGSGGGYGFDQASEIAFSLEKAAMDKNKTAVQNFSSQLEEYFHNLEIVYEED